jgi:hypothetical protein
MKHKTILYWMKTETKNRRIKRNEIKGDARKFPRSIYAKCSSMKRRLNKFPRMEGGACAG